ncbi:hypothetical protein [Halomonas elongata]|uniref:hypothetical protein n=1 Tax=Halomonas elongata TaxID=2746 RepID=UPI00186BA928|nr:hypothetical protein [Halomonas elongata]MBW5802018.1 hypothetical protein [Halomonas elongata]
MTMTSTNTTEDPDMNNLSRENQQRAAETLQAYLSNRATLDGSEAFFGSSDPEGGAVRAARAIRAAFAELEREGADPNEAEETSSDIAPDPPHVDMHRQKHCAGIRLGSQLMSIAEKQGPPIDVSDQAWREFAQEAADTIHSLATAHLVRS